MSDERNACVDCGKDAPVLDIYLGDKPTKIRLGRCFDCSRKIEEEQAKIKKRSEVVFNLQASKIPRQIGRLLESGTYALTYGQEIAMEKAATEIWKSPSPYFYGPVGAGKTFCSCKMIYDYITETGLGASFVSLANIIDPKFHNIKEDCSQVGHPLVLDDLGNHTITQKIVSYLFNLVNYRINTNLPTIITCNADPISLNDRLTATLGESESHLIDSFCDRLLELCKPIRVDGKSIRTQRFLESNG